MSFFYYMQSWHKIAKPLGSPWPNGRESHAFGYCDQFLTVVGGLNNDDVIMEDAWILNTDSMEWKEVYYYIKYNH